MQYSQSVMYNAITDIKNTLERPKSRVIKAEVRVSVLDDRAVELNKAKREKVEKEVSIVSDTS